MREIPRLAGRDATRSTSRARTRFSGAATEQLAGEAEIEETDRRPALSRFGCVVLSSQRRDGGDASLRFSSRACRRPVASSISTAASVRFRSFSPNMAGAFTASRRIAHAVAEAKANAQRNGLRRHVRFEAGRVEQLADAPGLRAALRDAGVVFLDPPRKGCDEVTLGAIAAARVPALVVPLVRPGNAGTGFQVPRGQGLPALRPCSHSTCFRRRATSRRSFNWSIRVLPSR